MDRQPHRKQKPEFFEPLKIFFAILIVSLVFFAPIVRSEKAETPNAIQEYPALNPFASSADACPWNCIKCTEWDPDAWPKTCLTYECTDASGNCGDPGDGGGGGYPPPTISHVLTCSNTGNNGWCIGTLSLDLTAADPQGQSVVISGTINGDSFACPSGQTTCSIPLPEASGTVTYKVDSATGLSANGSTSYHLDVTTPQISGDINGSSGTNGWFISQTSVTASASDSLSGLASFEVNVNNTGYASYSDTTFTDGTHTIQFRATDNAGNVTETAQQSINVDTTAPTLDLSTTGTIGQNGWYVSAVILTPTASDTTSGLYSFEATTDGVTWTSVSAPITLTDGIYTVQFRATDNAGNVSQTPSQQIKVDATTPNLSLDINGIRGQNDWYISSVAVTPNASDGGSGINKVEASVDNGS
ncbi:MAG TPA: Ig-like domain-containing protein, partial [Anaerolineales bacterium]|nr:Ig-like domain-containing protein [Anaerolineales bacterium]